jgi:hypothetical protein
VLVTIKTAFLSLRLNWLALSSNLILSSHREIGKALIVSISRWLWWALAILCSGELNRWNVHVDGCDKGCFSKSVCTDIYSLVALTWCLWCIGWMQASASAIATDTVWNDPIIA